MLSATRSSILPAVSRVATISFGEALYVETVLLPERLGISDETSAIEPSRKLKNEILKLYERKCFACGSAEGLEIDHIEPEE